MPRDAEEKRTHITQDLECCHGADNSRRLYSITSVHDGKTEVVVEQTICQRFPVTKLEDAEQLYDRLGRWHYNLRGTLLKDSESDVFPVEEVKTILVNYDNGYMGGDDSSRLGVPEFDNTLECATWQLKRLFERG